MALSSDEGEGMPVSKAKKARRKEARPAFGCRPSPAAFLDLYV
jgi:hypothetical protein